MQPEDDLVLSRVVHALEEDIVDLLLSFFIRLKKARVRGDLIVCPIWIVPGQFAWHGSVIVGEKRVANLFWPCSRLRNTSNDGTEHPSKIARPSLSLPTEAVADQAGVGSPTMICIATDWRMRGGHTQGEQEKEGPGLRLPGHWSTRSSSFAAHATVAAKMRQSARSRELFIDLSSDSVQL